LNEAGAQVQCTPNDPNIILIIWRICKGGVSQVRERSAKQKNILFDRLFFDFFRKNQKTGDQTLFYFAAGGGEILVTHPLYCIRRTRHDLFYRHATSPRLGMCPNEK
jgi:hypothetical protein